MTWALLALVPPLLWAIVNYVDKYLLSKTEYESTVNVLMVYSTFFSLLVLPILFLYSHFVSGADLFINSTQILVQILSGILVTVSIYFYLLALNEDEASNVIPLALLVPIFGYIFGYVLLGEILSVRELIACGLVLFGAFVLSVEVQEERKIRFKWYVLFLMIICSAFQAAQETLFKFVTIDNSTVTSLFWMHVGILVYGIVLVLLVRGLFGKFVQSVRSNGAKIFGVNVVSEGISAVAYMIANYATLFAPLALVMTLNSFQPAFVFILGVLSTIFFPQFATEKIKAIHLAQKSFAIGVMIFATYLMI